jgi:hypothetical protein
MATKRHKEKDCTEELKALKKRLAKQKEQRKKLILCLKECLQKLEHPPWHYGPHCK